jgi:hypothetical protein
VTVVFLLLLLLLQLLLLQVCGAAVSQLLYDWSCDPPAH